MSNYIRRSDAIDQLVEIFKLQAKTARAIVETIPAADVVDRMEFDRVCYDLDLAKKQIAAIGNKETATDENGKVIFSVKEGAGYSTNTVYLGEIPGENVKRFLVTVRGKTNDN